MSELVVEELAIVRAEYLSHPGTINYFDEDGAFVIAPNLPEYRAEKRAWEARPQEEVADES